MNDEIEESTLSVNRLIALCGVSLMVWVVIILGVVKVMEKF